MTISPPAAKREAQQRRPDSGAEWALGVGEGVFLDVRCGKDHVLAKLMARDARPPQPKEECGASDGILRDLVAIYPKGARWEGVLPLAIVFDGPVMRLTDQMNAAFAK